MEPIDYEKFIVTNRVEIEKDTLKNVLAFPVDDIELIEINRKICTVEPSKPEIESVIKPKI